MPALDPRSVLAANDAWVWLPDTAERVETPEYLLAVYPSYLDHPTQVLRTDSDRRPAELVAEVLGHVRDHGRPDVVWWTHDATSPADLEGYLEESGAERVEQLTVLARALDERIPAAPGEPEIRPVTDRATMLDDHRVAIAAFGEQMPPDDVIDQQLARLAEEPGTLHLVAYLDDEAVGIGGVSVVDGVARLWGGATVPAARRRGVYAALLRARLDWAHEHRASFALTRGRVDTSAPLLRKQGFGIFGETRGYRLSS